MKKEKLLKVYLIVVLAIILLSIPIILLFKVKPLVSGVFLFVLPSVYLFYRNPKCIKRILVGSLFIGVLMGFVFDFMAVLNHAWFVPDSQLVFPLRILGVVPFDEIIWFFFWVGSVLVFYEHFIEHERSDKISHNFKKGLLPFLTLLALILIVYRFWPEMMYVRYSYLIFGICAITPFIFLVLKRPYLLWKFSRVSFYFFFLYFVYEVSALYLGQWSFPGQYIGYVLVANYKFPFEEFFFWLLLSSSVVLSYYEEFVDDNR